MILRVSPHLFRGPQPLYDDLTKMRASGVKTVVNLRAESDDSEHLCRELELGYVHYPVGDWEVPEFAQIEEFCSLVADPARRKVLVHCFMGVGRTGLFVTCYRVWLGMPIEDAIHASDQETPGQGMNARQRVWIKEFAARKR